MTSPDFSLPIIAGISDFNSGSARLIPNTERAVSLFEAIFGKGCVSVDLPKTKVSDFIIFAQRKGMTVD